MLDFKANHAVDFSKKRIILPDANVKAGMEMRAALPHKDVAGKHELTVRALGPKTLGLAVTAVAGAAYALFVCEQLQIDVHHGAKPPFLPA